MIPTQHPHAESGNSPPPPLVPLTFLPSPVPLAPPQGTRCQKRYEEPSPAPKSSLRGTWALTVPLGRCPAALSLASALDTALGGALDND